jgi:hypothetical protein
MPPRKCTGDARVEKAIDSFIHSFIHSHALPLHGNEMKPPNQPAVYMEELNDGRLWLGFSHGTKWHAYTYQQWRKACSA